MKKALAAGTVLVGLMPLWALAETKPVKLSAGLEATVGFCGRNKEGDRLSVTMELRNTGKAVVQVALADRPVAVDNAGSNYDIDTFSGVAQCPLLSMKYVSECLGLPKPGNNYLPPQAYTQLDPDSTTTITMMFRGQPSKGTQCSIAMALLARIVQDPVTDATLSDDVRLKGARTLNLSIPAHPIVEGK